MPSSNQQMVFSFLADDPLYRRDVCEERVVAEVKAALEPVLRERMVDILHDMAREGFKEKLDEVVADAVKHAMADIESKFHDIRLFLDELLLRCFDCHDSVDW